MKKTVLNLLIFASGISVFGNSRSSYDLKTSREVWILSGGLILNGIGGLVSQRISPPDPEVLVQSDVFLPDRIAFRYHNTAAGWLSYITVGILAVTPLILTVSENSRSHDWTETVMYSETQIWTAGLTLLCKGIFQRPRPYVYQNLSASLDKDSARSFFSLHSSVAFAGAVSAGVLWEHFHQETKWDNVVWMTGLSLAAATGIFRILAGKHFPTDVIAGALVGSFAGWIIPHIHQTEEAHPQNQTNQSVRLTLRFAI